MQAPVLIQSTAALQALVETLAGERRLALDTEFHPERRYRPELLLVQLATEDGRCFLIDPLAVGLRPLAALVRGRTWLVHGGAVDLHLLAAHTGEVPEDVLDTQRLAAFAGLRYPARFEAVLEFLGQGPPPPSRTMSDWGQRPLHPSQLQYAAADVRLLPGLVRALEARLTDPARLRLAGRASMELVEEGPPWVGGGRAWRAFEVAPELGSEERAALQALLAWRERTAEERDQPARHVLADGLLFALARQRPRTMDALVQDRRLSSGLRRAHGEAILASLRAASESPAPPPVARAVPARMALLRAWALAFEAVEGIAAGLVLPPEVALAVAEEGSPALRGWRADHLGPALRAFERGAVGLVAGPEGPILRPIAGPALDQVA